MIARLLQSLRSPARPVAVPAAEPVVVDLSAPAATLRTLAAAYVSGDGSAILACVDDQSSAWPRGRVEGWAAFVEAAGRFRRAADAAFGAGAGDELVGEVLLRDPAQQGRKMLELLGRGALPEVSDGDTLVVVPDSFVLGPTRLVHTPQGWKLSGGPDHFQPPPKLDAQLLREAMDRSDRMIVADVETAHLLADEIAAGKLRSRAQVRSAGEREREKSQQRGGWAEPAFSQRLLKAIRKAGL